MDIVQTFYDNMAQEYDKLFADWEASSDEQGILLHTLFAAEGFDKSASVLDCACGIGTQAISLAKLGYKVTASDISEGQLTQARERADKDKVEIPFAWADFRNLAYVFECKFDIIIAMDNALPHMLTEADLEKALSSIVNRLTEGGIFVASIRDYDELLLLEPAYSPPYIHKTDNGQRVCFQTWEWKEENYKLTQYIIEDGDTLQISKYDCEYRATRRSEITKLLKDKGCSKVEWLFPKDTGFYQPIVVAGK